MKRKLLIYSTIVSAAASVALSLFSRASQNEKSQIPIIPDVQLPADVVYPMIFLINSMLIAAFITQITQDTTKEIWGSAIRAFLSAVIATIIFALLCSIAFSFRTGEDEYGTIAMVCMSIPIVAILCLLTGFPYINKNTTNQV